MGTAAPSAAPNLRIKVLSTVGNEPPRFLLGVAAGIGLEPKRIFLSAIRSDSWAFVDQSMSPPLGD